MNKLANPIQMESNVLVRNKRTRDFVREKYENPEGGKKVLVSYFIGPSQKAMIDEIAGDLGKSQAAVLRGLIDEWSQAQINESG